MPSEKQLDLEKRPLLDEQVDQQPVKRPPRRQHSTFVILVIFALAFKIFWFTSIWRWNTFAHLTQKQAEDIVLAIPNNHTIVEYSKAYTLYAHYAGSQGDWETVKHTKRTWEQLLGLRTTHSSQNVFEAGTKDSRHAFEKIGNHPTVHVDTYHSLLSKPLGNSSVTFHDQSGKAVFAAKLKEAAFEKDPTSLRGSEDVPVSHGFSKAGMAQGPLVYVNYGRKGDFDELANRGVSLNGSIVIARYGANFRGLKVSLAEEAGAIGVLIYSDPAEDGNITLANDYKAYPDGPARQPSAVQRGSVQALPLYPGDPLTPGIPAYKDQKRLGRNAKGLNIPGIPSLPISYEDALPLLATLKGHGHKIADWQGGLADMGLTYFTGPGQGTVKMDNRIVEDIKPIWNVYAIIPGHVKDEVVVLGNHRDAWVFGASDPNSGSASTDAIVEGLGVLLRKGWKPHRTIVIASWDAEEFGLIGSTEFGEDFGRWLDANAAMYLNLDAATAGSILEVGASPSLSTFFKDIAKRVQAPDEPKKTLYDYLKGENAIKPLGSGSDYTVFLQHIGIASSDISFKRGHNDPVYHYHSIYDSEYWMETYGDPGFRKHVAISQILGLALVRSSMGAVLPLNLTDYAVALRGYADSAKKAAKNTVPKTGTSFDDLDFKALYNAVEEIGHAVGQLKMEIQECNARLQAVRHICPQSVLAQKVRKINKRLVRFERNFIDKDGLNGREWYKHLVIAPGRYLGYGAQPMPGFIEAIILDKDGDAAKHELKRLVKVLNKVAEGLH